MKKEGHVVAFKEHLRKLKECVEEGLLENQRNIAYNASQGSVELFSLYMHHLNIILAGEQWDHRTFKSKENIENRVPNKFPERDKILELMKIIEEGRILLCYGKRKPGKKIVEVIDAFHELKNIISEKIGDLDEEK